MLLRQYAHTASNMGLCHVAQEGEATTFCGQPVRDTATWGPEATYLPGDKMCPPCKRLWTRVQQKAGRR